MKVIDHSPYIAQPGRLTLRERVEGSVMHGFSWPQEFAAQQTCIDILGNTLGDDFTILRNISLDDLEIPIPLVLIGPPGLYVMFVSPQIGSFRAKENEWLSLESARKAKPVLPNLLARTGLMAQAVDVHLAKNSITAPRSKPVLVCTNPHMYVECVHPVVEVQLSDTIEYFAANLTKAPVVISPQELQQVLDDIVPPSPEEPPVSPAVSQEITPEVSQPAQSVVTPADKPVSSPPRKVIPKKRKWFQFNRGQWIALAVISLAEVIALVIVTVLALKLLGW